MGKEGQERNSEKKKGSSKVTSKQVVAIGAIVLLVLMYVISLILAIFDNTASGVMFRASLVGTFAIPLLAWVYIWMYGKLSRKHTIADFDLRKDPEADSQIGNQNGNS